MAPGCAELLTCSKTPTRIRRNCDYWRIQMRKVVCASLLVGAAALMGVQVQAQTPAAPPAAGGTADGIPFDIPYGTPVSLETARKLIAAVEAEAVKHRWKFNIA